jgi:hypothetical protein
MIKLLIGLLALGSISAIANREVNEFTYKEWKTKCYEEFISNGVVTKRALNEAMSCAAGKEMHILSYSNVPNPFKEQIRPLDTKLQAALDRCANAYNMLANSEEFYSGDHNRAAVPALFFCMGQNP